MKQLFGKYLREKVPEDFLTRWDRYAPIWQKVKHHRNGWMLWFWFSIKAFGTRKNSKRLPRRTKKNRNSDCGGLGQSLHSAGSIPITEHRRRLKEKLGEEPLHAALFQATHKRKKTDEYVCKSAAQVLENVSQLQQLNQNLEMQLLSMRLQVISRKEVVCLGLDQIPNTTSPSW